MELFNQYPWLLAIAIFFSRICDVSLGTMRTIVVFRGYRALAGLIGFFEVLIWILAAGKVLRNLDQWYLIAGYCAGFATGNMVGIWLESKLAMGAALVTAISEDRNIHLSSALRDQNYVVTELDGKGRDGLPIEIALIAEKRRHLPPLLALIEKTDPNAFYTVEDIRKCHNAIFRTREEKTDKIGNIWAWTKKK